jgi:hypothetical protein
MEIVTTFFVSRKKKLKLYFKIMPDLRDKESDESPNVPLNSNSEDPERMSQFYEKK